MGNERRDKAMFLPLRVRRWEFRNRIVMPPMVTCRSLTAPEGVAWYGQHAAGGVALVIVEATGVPRFGSDLTVSTLQPLVEAVHGKGALIAIQLFPTLCRDDKAVGDLRAGDIRGIVDAYGTAARICLEAGFDGVEPHGAHGFLLNRFFSPLHNHRQDAYGGTVEKRGRLALEIVRSVREAVGDRLLLLYRHTPEMEGSYSVEESLGFAKRMVDEGVDILDISPSTREAPADLAAPFKQLGVPVIAVGMMDTPGRAQTVLGENRADLIAIGRELIADPDWPRKVRSGDRESVVQCIRCDLKCFGNLRAGIPIACTQWSEQGADSPEKEEA